MTWTLVRTLGLIAFAALVSTLCGCAPKGLPPQIVRVVETVEVPVPTPILRTPPAELLHPVPPVIPVFLDPTDPTASSALSVDGERHFRGLIEWYESQLAAWRTWIAD
jgi:hypothetical protein